MQVRLNVQHHTGSTYGIIERLPEQQKIYINTQNTDKQVFKNKQKKLNF